MSSRPLSDANLLRILEESDGEDEVFLELEDAAVSDSIDIQLPLEDQELLENEDSIEVIEQFIMETNDPVEPSEPRKRCLSCYKKLKDAGSTTKEAQKK